jgi:hypothetical protein
MDVGGRTHRMAMLGRLLQYALLIDAAAQVVNCARTTDVARFVELCSISHSDSFGFRAL